MLKIESIKRKIILFRIKIKALTQTEYEKIKIRVNEVVKPLINHLNEKNEESNEINNINISYMLNKMKTNSETLIGNFGSKSTAINNIERSIQQIK